MIPARISTAEDPIADAVRGDATLFTRWDAVQRAWEIVMPILSAWKATPDQTFPNYPSGSQGPASAEALAQADEQSWRQI